jgi:hypothetical protein
MKIVVFDLDETLGYFTQLGIFWDCLQEFLYVNGNNKKLTQLDFNQTLDLFPEFLRPNIIPILQYLKHKKNTNCCHKLMIYTNNTGPKEWAHYIKSYFEEKLNSKLIDQIISAFKINGKRVEMCRTTHYKSHDDLIRCTKVPLHSEICFLDDTFYPNMTNNNIYYINLKPYFYDLKFEYMFSKFKESEVGQSLIQFKQDDFDDFMKKQVKRYNYVYSVKSAEEYEIDKILGKHVLSHLQTFFNDNKRNVTRRSYTSKKNKTRKQI